MKGVVRGRHDTGAGEFTTRRGTERTTRGGGKDPGVGGRWQVSDYVEVTDQTPKTEYLGQL